MNKRRKLKRRFKVTTEVIYIYIRPREETAYKQDNLQWREAYFLQLEAESYGIKNYVRACITLAARNTSFMTRNTNHGANSRLKQSAHFFLCFML